MKRRNLFGRAVRAILKTASISWSDEAFWSTWTPQGAIAPQGFSEMKKAVGDATGIDVIMAPVLWIARRMAESPIGVSNVDDPSIDFTHDVARLLKYPTPWYAGSTERMALAVNYLMDGNGYLRKIRDPRDKPITLVFIPSWCIEPMIPPLNQGYIEFYQYNPGGLVSSDQSKTMLIPARDIVHLRYGIDPNFTRKGISALKILLREIYTDVQGSTMTAMLLKNAGLFGAVISPKAGVTIQKPTETKKYIEEEFAGVRMGKPLIMTAPTDVTYFGMEAAKLDLSALRDVPEERICAVLNIPSAVVGLGTGMKQTKVGATLVELRAMAYEDCIIPTQNSWCDEFDLQLMPDFEDDPQDWHVQFDNSNVRVLQDDENRISDRLVKQLVSGGIYLDEFRANLGYEADEKTEHVLYIPSTVTPMPAKELTAPPPPPPEPAPAGGPNAEGDTQEGDGSGQAPGGGPNAEGGKAWWARYLKPGLHGRARFTPKLSRFMHTLARQEKSTRKVWAGELAALFTAYGEHVASEFLRTASRRGVKEVDQPDWTLIAIETLQDTGNIAGLLASFQAKYLAIAKATYGSIDAMLGLAVMLSDPTEAMILRMGGKRMGLIDFAEQTRTAMFDEIAAAREAGAGPAEIARSLAQSIAAGPWGSAETRAMVIARTETKYAQNYASLEAYRASENVTDVLIFDAQLGPTDEECEALNGETVSLEEAQALMESEHPNGTRSFAPVVGEKSARRGNGNGNGKTALVVNLPKTITMRREGKEIIGTIEEVSDGERAPAGTQRHDGCRRF